MDGTHPDPGPPEVQESDTVYCYAHPKEPTRLRCSRCDRPICGRCAIPATVGQHCPECVAEARRSAPKTRSVAFATAPVVTTILIINAVVFFGQFAIDELTDRLVMFPPAVAEGQWYRLFTAMLLHSPTVLFHILFNSLVLWIYGPHVEQAIGGSRFGFLYVTAGFAGSATSFSFGGCNPSLGASGAIFGVVGALLVMLYGRRSSLLARQFLRNVWFFVGINVAFGFIAPNIDWLAHLGGLVAGAALGFAYDRARAAGVQVALTIAVAATAAALVLYRSADFVCNGLFR